MATRDDVEKAVMASFAEAQRSDVMSALAGYSWPNEPSRVRHAILVLSDGDPDEIGRLVKSANADYRDLLYWAEYPEESGSGTKKQMADGYRNLGVTVPSELA
jgi:hypothetical protein